MKNGHQECRKRVGPGRLRQITLGLCPLEAFAKLRLGFDARLYQGLPDRLRFIRSRQDTLDAEASRMVGKTGGEVDCTLEKVCRNLARRREQKCRGNVVHIALVVARKDLAEQRFLVAECGIEGWSLDTGGLGQVRIGRTLVALAPEDA